MSEPESLDTDEALDRRVVRHHFDRLIMLCDGAYAIAITLAAIEIHFPTGVPTLRAIWQEVQLSVLSYFVSFAVIANFWFGNRDLFARLHRVDSPLTLIVLAGLCIVALIPGSTHVLYSPPITGAGLQGYALTMVVAGALNCAAWLYGSLRPGLMLAEVPRGYRWRRIFGTATVPVLFLLMFLRPGAVGLKLALLALPALLLLRGRLIPRLFGRAVHSLAAKAHNPE